MSISQGQVINNRYRIVRLLGRGGYGTVYKAWDLTFELPCALKENTKSSPEAQNQFLREARLLRTLRHPNLPQVSDYFILPDPDSGENAAYLVMDYVDGEDLKEKLDARSAPFDEAQALGWISQICEALTYLHGQNPPVIHRDVKPANIKITSEGRAMLVDFGIAKSSPPGMPTTTGARALTAGYAPIEQYGGGGRTDARSDLYSLAATLYTLLVGQAPPEATERTPLTPLPSPRQLNPRISPSVDAALIHALELFPEERFQSVAEFKAALMGGAAASASQPGAANAAPTELSTQPPSAATPNRAGMPPIAATARSAPAAPSVWEAPAPEMPPGKVSLVQPQGAGRVQASPGAGIPPNPVSSPVPAGASAPRKPRRWLGVVAGLAVFGLVAAALVCAMAYRLVFGGVKTTALPPTRTATQFSVITEFPAAGAPTEAAAAPTDAAAYATAGPAEPAVPQPVTLLDGDTVTMTSAGNQYRYTILSAERQPLGAGKQRLHLRVRAWTDSGAGLNFWSDSFRLYIGDVHLAPVNNLNEIVSRDQTVDGDVDFEIDATLSEATLVVRSYGDDQQLRLGFPLSESAAATVAAPAVPTPTITGALPVELPDGPTVTLLVNGNQYRYTILSAERQPLGAGKFRLHLRVRAWTDSGAGLNFWSDSFRLKAGDQSIAPVNNLNEIVSRDQTVDGDVDFEIDATLKEGLLEMSAYSTTQQVRLLFP